MQQEIYEKLLNKIKTFEKKTIYLPLIGEQIKYNLIHIIDGSEKFTLIINRRGHRNTNNLSILLNSKTQNGHMIRFDVNGADHSNPPKYERVPTPHLHIFTDEYDNGRIAIPLKNIKNVKLINELIDALDFIMDYTNIERENIEIISDLFYKDRGEKQWKQLKQK
ncbi:DUF6978 family protein [Staphylococcus auricularis]|uniref:DUF6978 family protein n=1 Tax=Staphylococcus auricularis TaxID=29379 RepID=UPI00242E0D1D|nr:hypothetical protein [Staphylococcus auricularis]